MVSLHNTTRNLAVVAALLLVIGAAEVAVADPVQVGGPLFFGGHEYRLYAYQFNDDRDWTSAKTFATGTGVELVSINSAAENHFLLDNFVLPPLPGTRDGGWEHTVWTGGTDEVTEGTWVWDGEPGAGAFWIGGPAYSGGSPPAGQFANWAASEPNNSRNDDYLVMVLQGATITTPGLWFDAWGGQPDFADPVGGFIVELAPAVCPGDVNGDGAVDLSDLAILLAHFGTQSGATYGDGDLDNDGDVDLTDLTLMLANFGTTCS